MAFDVKPLTGFADFSRGLFADGGVQVKVGMYVNHIAFGDSASISDQWSSYINCY